MPAEVDRNPRPFAVLFVCTANQCRSPIAEALLRASLADLGVGWTVASRGTRAENDRPMHPLSSAVLDERDVEHEDWTSRRLDAAAVADADLVLTAEVAHRRSAVALHPAAVQYSFTLLQFSRLLEHAAPPRSGSPVTDERALGARLIRAAERARSRPQARDAHALELIDPIGRPIAEFRRTADTIDAALRVIVSSLDAERSAPA